MYLSIAAVLALEYQEFIDFFYSPDQNKFYAKFYFDKLKKELPEPVLNYWENLYKMYPLEQMTNLFQLEFVPDNLYKQIELEVIPSNIFLEEKNFYRLKKQLLQIKLKYLIADFGEIPKLLEREKFDVIYLSAMQNFVCESVQRYNFYEKLKEYEGLLNENGVIQAGYIYFQHLEEYPKESQMDVENFRRHDYEEVKINIIPEKDLGKYHISYLKRKREK